MLSVNLSNLSKSFDNVEITYTDIVNYEIARENICGYIFLLARKAKTVTGNEKEEIDSKRAKLRFIRDKLQIADKNTVAIILDELIPLYRSEAANKS